MSEQVTLDQLRSMAEKAGIDLPVSELERILPGVQRAFKQVAELREMIATTDEPAVLFKADK